MSPSLAEQSDEKMGSRRYWLDLFTGATWQEFLDSGASTSGFRERRRNTVKQIKPGDYLICYLTGVSRLIGLLEVTTPPYYDETPIWKDELFPWRMGVKILITLTPETGVPIRDLADRLSLFRDLSSPNAWTGHFRGSPAEWTVEDATVALHAIQNAKEHPTTRAVDPRKLSRKPRTPLLPAVPFPIAVSEPEINEPEDMEIPAVSTSEPSRHTEIQYLLLKLGKDMGFRVWAAKNDRSRLYNGKQLAELFEIAETLPLQFDQRTNATIELIDVLWLRGNAIVAAFEVESTTSIYSGLLRMSDLIAMQPNLNIPLYLVSPDERRNKVKREINRPTFARLSPPLVKICSFIAFETLESRLAQVAPYAHYLKPDFLQELSEDCSTD